VAVLGAGPIGILAALAARERRLEAVIWSREEPASQRAALVRSAGFEYASGSPVSADVIIEATGSPAAASAGIEMLHPLGVMVVLGAPESARTVPFVNLILGNQAIAGSVNAGPEHWDQAIRDLARFDRSILDSLIHRRPFDHLLDSLAHPSPTAPKQVHTLL
jgi:threonine dehydrogenase-like Zn-dependent dehydrogenase